MLSLGRQPNRLSLLGLQQAGTDQCQSGQLLHTPSAVDLHGTGSIGCLRPAPASSNPVLDTRSLLPLQWACMAPVALAGTTPRQPASSLSPSAWQLPLTQASCAAWGRSPAQRCELWAPMSGIRQNVSGKPQRAMLEGQGHTWPFLSLKLCPA